MRGLLWLLTLFALAVGIALAARFNDGYLLLVLPPYRAEISLNLAVMLVLGGFAMLYALLRAAALTLALPRRVREYRERRRREKAAESLDDVVRLILEGRYGQALKKAGEAHADAESPALAALLAARSAQRLGEHDQQQAWLERAARDDPKMQCACLMLEAEMHLAMRRYDDAVATLKRLQQASGRHVAALRLELLAQQGGGHWDEVRRITQLLEAHHALPAEDAAALRRQDDEALSRRAVVANDQPPA